MNLYLQHKNVEILTIPFNISKSHDLELLQVLSLFSKEVHLSIEKLKNR